MNICLFTSSFLPVIGGGEFAVHHLAECLAQLGHKIVVLAGRETKRSNKVDIPHSYTLRRYRYPPKGIFVNQLLFQLMVEKIRNNFDVLHASFLYFPGYVAVSFKKIFNVPVVVTAHGEDIQVRKDINYGMMLNPKREHQIKHVLQKADAITAISDSIRTDFLNAGASPEKIFSIPHGTDVRAFSTATNNIKNMFNISEDNRVIIAIGRNHEKKGFKYLLQAIPRIISKNPKTKFVIVGKGTEILKSEIDALGISEHIILSTPVTGNAYNSLYKKADIYVTPSLIEGASLTNLDALGAGLPLIATDVLGNRDFVSNYENGLLIEPRNPQAIADAVLHLLNDNELRCKLSKNSKEMGARHDWRELAKKYVNVYEKVISKTKGK